MKSPESNLEYEIYNLVCNNLESVSKFLKFINIKVDIYKVADTASKNIVKMSQKYVEAKIAEYCRYGAREPLEGEDCGD